MRKYFAKNVETFRNNAEIVASNAEICCKYCGDMLQATQTHVASNVAICFVLYKSNLFLLFFWRVIVVLFTKIYLIKSSCMQMYCWQRFVTARCFVGVSDYCR